MAAPGSARGSARVGNTGWPRARFIVIAVLALSLAALAAGAGAGAAPTATVQSTFAVTQLTPVSRVEGAKSASGRLARTDESLLGKRSTKPIHVIVKLDYDPLAACAGQITGLPATSPSVTGKGLNLRSDAARRYERFVGGVEQRFRDSLRARIPDASARAWLRVAYGGVALTLPEQPGRGVAEAPRRGRGAA